jgi:hypothetical protein
VKETDGVWGRSVKREYQELVDTPDMAPLRIGTGLFLAPESALVFANTLTKGRGRGTYYADFV